MMERVFQTGLPAGVRKNFLQIILIFGIILQSNYSGYGQSVGDYRSSPFLGSTNWSFSINWQRWNGTLWVGAPAAPSSSDGVITIRSGHTIEFAGNLTLDQVVVEFGATLSGPVLAGTATVILADGPSTDMVVNGTLTLNAGCTLSGNGTLLSQGAGVITLNATTLAVPTTNNAIMNVAGGTIQTNNVVNNGTMTITSGTLQGISVTNSNILSLSNTLTLSSGGSVINNLTFNLTSTATAITGTGSITNSSGGTIYKSSATGLALINSGVSFSNAGLIKGFGEYSILSTTLVNTGSIDPGNSSTAALSINPALVTGKSPAFHFEVNTTGATAGTNYDQVVLTTASTTDVSGASLSVSDFAGDPANTTYTLFRSPTGSITGTFASVTLPSTFGPLIYSANTITVKKLISERHWIATTQQNWNAAANWSGYAGGPGGETVPSTQDAVFFDAVRNGNCVFNTAPSILRFTINSGYSGTITQGSNALTVSGPVSLNGGTFSGGSSAITIGGAFTLSGTSFTSTTSILELQNTAAFTSGTFTHQSGTVKFNSINVTSPVVTGTSPTFYNLELVGLAKTLTLSSTGSLTVSNNFILSGTSSLTLNSGTIDVFGNIQITNTATGGGGTTSIQLRGTNAQNLQGPAVVGQGVLPAVVINKTSNNVNLSGFISVAQDWTQSSGTVNAGSAMLSVAGNLTINSIFNSGSGTIVMNGASAQNISGTATTTFNHLTITNNSIAGARVQSNQNLRGILMLGSNARFDADGTTDNSIFTLLSSADSPVQDAAIATLPSGATVSGNVTVQRFMSQEGVNSRLYRYIAAPVMNARVSDLQQEIPVTGSFTGTSICGNCTTNGSLFYYNESVITNTNGDAIVDKEDGYVEFPDVSNTELFQSGRGYAMYVRGDLLSSARWDLRGTVVHANSSPVSLPVSFTTSGVMANDGWNLVGNPFASMINWDTTGWSKTNLDGSIYIRDNATSRVATWNGSVGANGGSKYIPTGQGFWVKANAASPALTLNEITKTPRNTTVFFRDQTMANVLRIRMSDNDDADETVIHLRPDATPDFDHHADAFKLASASFDLSSLSATGEKLSINSWSDEGCSIVIPLHIDRATAGNYDLTFSGIQSLDEERSLFLIDLATQDTVLMDEGTVYSFTVATDQRLQEEDRFKVLLRKNKTISIVEENGMLLADEPGAIQWFKNDVLITDAISPEYAPDESGIYSVTVTQRGCSFRAARYVVITGAEVIGTWIRTYPNPVMDKLTVSVPAIQVDSGIVTTSTGSVMGDIVFRSDGHRSEGIIDFSGYRDGLYFLQIIVNGRTFVRKIIKQ